MAQGHGSLLYLAVGLSVLHPALEVPERVGKSLYGDWPKPCHRQGVLSCADGMGLQAGRKQHPGVRWVDRARIMRW